MTMIPATREATAMPVPALTPAELTEARDWIADCEWADDVSELTDAQVERGIARHYAGGIEAFRADAAPLMDEAPGEAPVATEAPAAAPAPALTPARAYARFESYVLNVLGHGQRTSFTDNPIEGIELDGTACGLFDAYLAAVNAKNEHL